MAAALPPANVDIGPRRVISFPTCVRPALDASAFWGYREPNNEGRVEHFGPATPDAVACRPGRAVPCHGLRARRLRRRRDGDVRRLCDGKRWRRPNDCVRI